MEESKRDLAAKSSILYYENNKTQNDIAKELNVSRSYVSQLLNFAREEGIVHITINIDEFSLRMIRKEIEVKSFFPSLHQVYIMKSESESFTNRNLGKFAAPYLAEMINRSKIIGINPGLSVEKSVKYLKNQNIILGENRKVVQIMGGYNSSSQLMYAQPNEIAKKLGEELSCESYFLNCPAVIEQKDLRDKLIQEGSIRNVMDLWKGIDLAIMGLGVADSRSKIFSLYNADSQKEILNSGAVGVLNTSYFDINGNFIRIQENNKIGISLDDIKKVSNKVIICSGEAKSKALLGALRGKLVDTLITDSLAIDSVLNIMNDGSK